MKLDLILNFIINKSAFYILTRINRNFMFLDYEFELRLGQID
jgi:hypothetical protein